MAIGESWKHEKKKIMNFLLLLPRYSSTTSSCPKATCVKEKIPRPHCARPELPVETTPSDHQTPILQGEGSMGGARFELARPEVATF